MQGNNLAEVLGFKCHLLEEGGNVSLIETPFEFIDGAEMPLYTEELSNQIRLFDGGETLLALHQRGLDLNKPQSTRFINKIVNQYGLTLNGQGDIELYCTPNNISLAFANYVLALSAIRNWEVEQEDKYTDADLLIREVALYFISAYPNESQTPSPSYQGISGHKHKFDFIHGKKAILSVSLHHASISSALKKLIDLNVANVIGDIEPIIVLDDRADLDAAKNEMKLISSVVNVMPLTALENKAKFNNVLN